jgi:serine/threonine protein kinase
MNGIQVDASDCTIGSSSGGENGRVVASGNGQVGVYITPAAKGTTLTNVFSGVDKTGANAVPNVMNGIQVDASDCTIGSSSGGENGRVVASGNTQVGVHISSTATNTSLANVFAGVDKTLSVAVPNGDVGIFIEAIDCTIGSSTGGENGLVVASGNGLAGVVVVSTATNTSLANVFACSNSVNGIYVDARDCTIGSSSGGENGRVVASGNGHIGVYITPTATGTTLANVFAGVDETGAVAVPNVMSGIQVAASDCTIGSSTGGKYGRVVASGNAQDGVYITPTATNTSLANVFAGIDESGAVAVPNGLNGISVEASDCTIGSSSGGKFGRVVASGNFQIGVSIKIWATGTALVNVFVGVDMTGSVAVPNYYDGLAVHANKCTIGSAVDGESGRVVASGNAKRGVFISSTATNTFLSNVFAGIDMAGAVAIGNGQHGIEIDARECTIGFSADGKFGRIVASGNARDGVFISSTATGTTLANVFAGVDKTGAVAIPNGDHGIHVGSSECTIGSSIGAENGRVVASGNTKAGVYISPTATNTTLTNVFAGVDETGGVAVPNGAGGIYVDASDCTIGSGTASESGRVVASGNSENGVHITSTATGTILTNVFAGIDKAGAVAVPNGAHGIQVGASECAIGSRTGDESGRVVASGNAQCGIYITSTATGTTLTNVFAGVDNSGIITVPNGFDGIRVDASKCTIGSATGGEYGRVVASGNFLNGVDIHGLETVLQHCIIGLDAYGTAVASNSESGVRIGSTVKEVTFGVGVIIGGNRHLAIRDERGFAGGESTSRASIISRGPLANGWGILACSMCTCTPDIRSADFNDTIAFPTRRGEVDCSGIDLGIIFPQLPRNTSILRLSATSLKTIDWPSLVDAIGPTVQVLDFGGNPDLDALPESGRFVRSMFPVLTTLDLHGTMLNRLSNNTFIDLDGKVFGSLDLSEPSPHGLPPKSTNVDLTGLNGNSVKPLGAVLWFDNDQCPMGYYATTASPSRPNVGVCARCPFGTTKRSVGGLAVDCKPCPTGEVDLDGDPTTACEETSKFKVTLDPVHKLPDWVVNAYTALANDGDTEPVPINYPNETKIGVGMNFRFTPPNISPTESTFSKGGVDDVSYTFQIQLQSNEKTPGQNHNPTLVSLKSNGELLGVFQPRDVGKLNVAIIAVDGGSATAVARRMVLDVRYTDVDTANAKSRGPGGSSDGCNGGRKIDDGNMFDLKYTCECASGQTGDNCENTIKTPSQTIGIIVAALVSLMCAAGVLLKYRKFQESKRPVDFETKLKQMLEAGDITDEQAVAKKKPREISRSCVTLLEQVGEGAFGAVWKGVLDESKSGGPPEYQVAAKTVLKNQENQAATNELLAEAMVMAQVVGHQNLVSIIGIVTSGSPYMLILSLCDHGSLLSELRKRAASGGPVSDSQKLELGGQTARGMEHLSKCHFIHRDLAARNVLLTSGVSECGLVCKVADFGLSRGGGDGSDDNGTTYYRSKQGVFPIRWTAPESMETLVFNQASDVWSFGIVLLEIAQDGDKPYYTIRSNPDVIHFVRAGKTHPKPPCCSNVLYSIMLECWSSDPGERPSFARLAAMLEGSGVEPHEGRQTISARPSRAAALGYGGQLLSPSADDDSWCASDEMAAVSSPSRSAATNGYGRQTISARPSRAAALGYGGQLLSPSADDDSWCASDEMAAVSSPSRSAATTGYGRQTISARPSTTTEGVVVSGHTPKGSVGRATPGIVARPAPIVFKGEPATESLQDNLVMHNLASSSDNVGETSFDVADSGHAQPEMRLRAGLPLNGSARSGLTAQTELVNEHTPATNRKLRRKKKAKSKYFVRRSNAADTIQLLDADDDTILV